MTLDKLMKKFIEGDKSAFEEIYVRTKKSVYYVALSYLRERSLAEDVMQSTYLNVLKNACSYRFGTNAAAWIMTIARNEALNLKKSRSRETDSFDAEENEAVYGACTTDDYGLLIDLARKLLADDEFTILMFVTACGYKRREIAGMLSMPISTVTWKYNSAIRKMRCALNDKGGD